MTARISRKGAAGGAGGGKEKLSEFVGEGIAQLPNHSLSETAPSGLEEITNHSQYELSHVEGSFRFWKFSEVILKENPAVGFFQLNNTEFKTTTHIFLSNLEREGTSSKPWIEQSVLVGSSLYLVQAAAGNTLARYKVKKVTSEEAGAWWDIEVEWLGGEGTKPAAPTIPVYFWADSSSPTGAAGGDLEGTYPNPTLAANSVSNVEVVAAAGIEESKIVTTGLVHIAGTETVTGTKTFEAPVAVKPSVAEAANKPLTVEGSKPANVSTTPATETGGLIFKTGTGGSTTDAVSSTGGKSGGITIETGAGGITVTAENNLAGDVGPITFQGGVGGASGKANAKSNKGGKGGPFKLLGGVGGSANSSESEDAKGGPGGTVEIIAGSGGAAGAGGLQAKKSTGGIGGGILVAAGAAGTTTAGSETTTKVAGGAVSIEGGKAETAALAGSVELLTNATLRLSINGEGLTTIKAGLTTEGATKLEGTAACKETLKVIGVTSAEGGLGVTGAATVSTTLKVTGLTSPEGGLTVTGATKHEGTTTCKETLKVAGTFTAEGEAEVAKKLKVTELLTASKGITVEGTGAETKLPSESITLANLGKPLKEEAATEIAAAPKAEAEITESGKGNGSKEPSATKPVLVYIKYKSKLEKASSIKIEVASVIVYEEVLNITANKTANTLTAGPFLVPKAAKLVVTFSECEKIIPIYHTL